MSTERLTPDEEALAEQLDLMTDLRKKGWVIDRLPEAPTETVPGCDDHANRFNWYKWVDPDGKVQGYTHLPKDVEF